MENEHQSPDRLEQFIRSHRADFDTEEPSAQVWEGLRERLDSSSSDTGVSSGPKGTGLLWWKVAAVFFFVTSVYLLFRQGTFDRPEVRGDVPELAQQGGESGTDGEFESVEGYYISLITEKQAQLEHYRSQGVSLDTNQEDFKKLEAMYQVLKEEMERNPSDKVVDAIILNLILRMDMLNEQLSYLKKLKSQKDSTTRDKGAAI